MRLLLFAAALTFPALAAHSKPPVAQSVVRISDTAATCADPALIHQAKPNRKAKMSKLTDLPPANLYLSVLRAVDGCQVPVIVRYGIGSTEPGRRR